MRVRTGLEMVTRRGEGDVPVRALVSDGLGGLQYAIVGTVGESWNTTWAHAPLQLELLGRPRPWRPYAGAGGGIAIRVAEHEDTVREVPTAGSRRFDPSASLTLGVELPRARGANRVELGWGHGLRSLYNEAYGPSGSWNAWSLVLDIGL